MKLVNKNMLSIQSIFYGNQFYLKVVSIYILQKNLYFPVETELYRVTLNYLSGITSPEYNVSNFY